MRKLKRSVVLILVMTTISGVTIGCGGGKFPVTQPPVTQPPVIQPPEITLLYPSPDGRQNVVGEGVVLTLKGYASNPLRYIEVFIENNKVAEAFPGGNSFEVDVTHFGTSKGEKEVLIKGTTTTNSVGECRLRIVYDEVLLDNLARDFLRRYSCIHEDGYRLVRFGNLHTGPYERPVRIYIWEELWNYREYIEKACNFWEKYTGIQFELILKNPGEEPRPLIGIGGEFQEESGIGAGTIVGTLESIYEITGGGITLYEKWLRTDQTTKIMVVAHELGHVLLCTAPGSPHTDDDSLMDANLGFRVLHCYQQRGARIMYRKAPGDKI